MSSVKERIRALENSGLKQSQGMASTPGKLKTDPNGLVIKMRDSIISRKDEACHLPPLSPLKQVDEDVDMVTPQSEPEKEQLEFKQRLLFLKHPRPPGGKCFLKDVDI